MDESTTIASKLLPDLRIGSQALAGACRNADGGKINGQPIIPPAPVLKHLAAYLEKLPPMIARKRVDYFTGGTISPKKLANDDHDGTGPLVRQRIGESIVYPTQFFLAYLESLGVKTIVPPPIETRAAARKRRMGAKTSVTPRS